MLHARRPLGGRVARRLLRLSIGSALLYMIAGTDKAVKLTHDDAQSIESEAGKHITDMDENELVETMRRLGIKSIVLTDEEQMTVLFSCPYCGHRNEQDARKCEKCGASI